MSKELKRQIIIHILDLFTKENGSFIANIKSDKFLLDKKLAIEEDYLKKEKEIFAATGKLDNLIVHIMLSEISTVEKEYVALIRLDDASPIGVRISYELDDFGDICFNVDDNNWIQANTLQQAKFLSGVEQLGSIFLSWEKMKDFHEMYRSLVGFLNSQNA